MKAPIAVLLAFLIAIGIAYAQSNRPTSSSPGRFQIVSADYEYLGKTSVMKQAGVFRIDTQTGETWLFASVSDDQGKLSEFWKQIRVGGQ